MFTAEIHCMLWLVLLAWEYLIFPKVNHNFFCLPNFLGIYHKFLSHESSSDSHSISIFDVFKHGRYLVDCIAGCVWGVRLFLGCFRLHADVSSPTRDQVQACAVGAWSLDYWVTRGVPLSCFFDLYYKTAFRVCCSVVILRFPFPVFKIEAPCLDSHFFPLDLLSHFYRTRLLVLFWERMHEVNFVVVVVETLNI